MHVVYANHQTCKKLMGTRSDLRVHRPQTGQMHNLSWKMGKLSNIRHRSVGL